MVPDGEEIIATGTPEQIALKDDTSYTGKYLKKILKK
jgi:excinuclease UvrABC ATPase subunit